jgi:hypothetical protein
MTLGSLARFDPIGLRRDPEPLPRSASGLYVVSLEKPVAPSRPKVAQSLNMMSELAVGDPFHPYSKESNEAWADYEQALHLQKELGIRAVSVDVWWGLIEPREGEFNFDYYDRMASTLARVGLEWVVNYSFHACGGNVGDSRSIPPGKWVGEKYRNLGPPSDPTGPFSRGEDGTVSRGAISPEASKHVLPDMARAMRAFQAHFASHRENIREINVSLGEAGELRRPSYRAGTPSDYPSRGSLQIYGGLAIASFRKFVLERYGMLGSIDQAWHSRVRSPSDIRPPQDAQRFFDEGLQHSPYGQDIFDWQAETLRGHGSHMLLTTAEVCNDGRAAFKGIDISGKVPGVHWRVGSDRAAELAAGLLKTSEAHLWNDDRWAHGYEWIVQMFEEVQRQVPEARVVLHFTCGEMNDGEGPEEAASLAQSLVRWVVEAAQRHGIAVGIENALEWALSDKAAMENMARAMALGCDVGTLLRSTALRQPGVPENVDWLAQSLR